MKVLLADDEPIARTMLEHWLAGWGYEVVCVSDGEAALLALRSDPSIRLAIVDWVMPKLDGIDVCRKVREGPSEPYVYLILLTARDNKTDIVDGLDAGADDYIVKPCNPLELKVRLRAGQRLVDLQTELVRAREALRVEAMTDALTGLLNRKALIEFLEREVARSGRTSEGLCLVMADLDHFKSVNDTYGHPAGDAVLREAAARFKQGVRAYDVVGRVGGEEMLFVLPKCDTRDGMMVAERLKWVLSREPILLPDGRKLHVTSSFGMASTTQSQRGDVDGLLKAADAALYAAKAAGRNCVKLATKADWPELAASESRMASTRQPSGTSGFKTGSA